jgi:hypothetical protein
MVRPCWTRLLVMTQKHITHSVGPHNVYNLWTSICVYSSDQMCIFWPNVYILLYASNACLKCMPRMHVKWWWISRVAGGRVNSSLKNKQSCLTRKLILHCLRTICSAHPVFLKLFRNFFETFLKLSETSLKLVWNLFDAGQPSPAFTPRRETEGADQGCGEEGQ